MKKWHRQTSNISRTLGNKFVDHSDVVGAAPTHLILDLTPGFKGLGNDNCETRREIFNCCDLVRFILEVWRYELYVPLSCFD